MDKQAMLEITNYGRDYAENVMKRMIGMTGPKGNVASFRKAVNTLHEAILDDKFEEIPQLAKNAEAHLDLLMQQSTETAGTIRHNGGTKDDIVPTMTMFSRLIEHEPQMRGLLEKLKGDTWTGLRCM